MLFRRAASRLYAVTLRAFPRRHRDAYAAEMTDSYERALAARIARGGGWSACGFVASACLNAVTTGIGERLRQRRRRFGPLFSAPDFTLAWRMLVRYPGLSLVSVFGIAVGIAIAAGAFTIVSAVMESRLPLPDGDRVVSLANWDANTSNRELRLIHDFTEWRAMTSIEDLSITRTVQRNLIADGRQPETVTVAEIAASAFQVARVAALRGRYLLPEDERPDAGPHRDRAHEPQPVAPRHRAPRVAHRRQPEEHAVGGLEEQVEGEAGLPVPAADQEQGAESEALGDPRRHPVAQIGAGVVPLEEDEEQREDDGPREVGGGGDFEGGHWAREERIIG